MTISELYPVCSKCGSTDRKLYQVGNVLAEKSEEVGWISYYTCYCALCDPCLELAKAAHAEKIYIPLDGEGHLPSMSPEHDWLLGTVSRLARKLDGVQDDRKARLRGLLMEAVEPARDAYQRWLIDIYYGGEKQKLFVPEGGLFPDYYYICTSGHPWLSMDLLEAAGIPYYYSAANPKLVLARVHWMTGRTEGQIGNCGLERVKFTYDEMISAIRALSEVADVKGVDFDIDEDDLADDHDDYDLLQDCKWRFIDRSMDKLMDEAIKTLDDAKRDGFDLGSFDVMFPNQLGSVTIDKSGMIVASIDGVSMDNRLVFSPDGSVPSVPDDYGKWKMNAMDKALGIVRSCVHSRAI